MLLMVADKAFFLSNYQTYETTRIHNYKMELTTHENYKLHESWLSCKSNPAHMIRSGQKSWLSCQRNPVHLMKSGQKSCLNCTNQPGSHYVISTEKLPHIAVATRLILRSKGRKAGSIAKGNPDHLMKSGQKSCLILQKQLGSYYEIKAEKLAQLQKQPNSIICISGQKSWLNCKNNPAQ